METCNVLCDIEVIKVLAHCKEKSSCHFPVVRIEMMLMLLLEGKQVLISLIMLIEEKKVFF